MRTWVGRRTPRDEQGAVAVLTALVMVGLMLFAAIVIDLGYAKDVRRQSQNAGDAASLAGAAALYPAAISPSTTPKCVAGPETTPPCLGDAAEAVKAYALKNFQVAYAAWGSCTVAASSALAVPSTGPNCISFDSASTQVRVNMPTRAVSTFFGGVTGRPSIPVGSLAQALVVPAVSCTLCFLGDVSTNNSDFSVTDGSIAVKGKVTAHGKSVWTSQSNGVVGDAGGATYLPNDVVKIRTFGDPLASLILPSTTGLPIYTKPCTDGPGAYYVSFSSLDCDLKPGLYVIYGTWALKNKDVLSGTGVTLYVKSPGNLDFKNGDPKITAPAPGEPNAGYVIIYDRTYTSKLELQGNGTTLITGVVYAPATILQFNGNSKFTFSGGPVILGGSSSVGEKSGVIVTNPKSIELTAKGLQLDR